MQTSERTLFRVYEQDELGPDGYPRAWHRIDMPALSMEFLCGTTDYGIKDIVRAAADHRCVRCGHPYRKGAHGNGEWSPCDERCTHEGSMRWRFADRKHGWECVNRRWPVMDRDSAVVEAHWRILTVHHLTGVKADLHWWNLAALCQRCHLTIQGRVVMERAFILEHSDWFKPYAAGWYAHKYLGEDLTREEAVARQDELLALERLV